MDYYDFSFIHRAYDYDEKSFYLLYKFKSTILNQVYLVSFYEYPQSVYIAKFYLKSERFSPNKYSNTTFGKFDYLVLNNSAYIKNFFLVMNTILQIAIQISHKDKLASFGFLGSHKETEMYKINSDKTFSNTRRYLVYKKYVSRYFNPLHFEHIDSETSSIYIVVNRKNTKLTKENIENYITHHIIPSL